MNTVVLHLRECADRLIDLYAENPEATVFFPPRERGERQPRKLRELRGRVPVRDVAGLVQYVADMLEE
ncbi:MAG TPA: hypothetical protein VMG99_08820 [Thermoplasmata archaeon]|nr:hypothetical protein [Thermoplasmata archaeon]